MEQTTASSAPRGATFIREWRRHRGLTQEQVAGRLEDEGGDVPKTKASLSRLENGKQPYSQATLEALARILGVTPAQLIAQNPNGETAEIIDIWDHADLDQRRQILRVAEALTSYRA